MHDVVAVYSHSALRPSGLGQLLPCGVDKIASLVVLVAVETHLQGLVGNVGVEVDHLAVGLTSADDDLGGLLNEDALQFGTQLLANQLH